MGEIADMMLNGDMCEGCGVWLGGEGDGFPRYCSKQCRQDRMGPSCDNVTPKARHESPEQIKARKPFVCAECGKRFRKEIAVADHTRAAHASAQPNPTREGE